MPHGVEGLEDRTSALSRVWNRIPYDIRDRIVAMALDLALAASGCDRVKVEHRPRLLSYNGPCYVASDLGEWLETYKIDQVHGAPGHP